MYLTASVRQKKNLNYAPFSKQIEVVSWTPRGI